MTMTTATPATTALEPDIHDDGPVGTWLREVAILTRRNPVHIRREPEQLSSATVQPAKFTLLFST